MVKIRDTINLLRQYFQNLANGTKNVEARSKMCIIKFGDEVSVSGFLIAKAIVKMKL